MMGFERSDDYQPLFWVRGRPVHVTVLLVAIHVISMVAACLLVAGNLPNPYDFLSYDGRAILHGQVWRAVTYVFVHAPSLWFVVDMAMLFLLGREVERYFGRKVFAVLYAALTLTSPLVLMALHLMWGGEHGLASVGGDSLVNLGVFIAFVTIYPNVQFFFAIPAVWIAGVILTISTLICLQSHDWEQLIVLWTMVAVAFFGTRYASIGSEAFALFGNLRDYFPRRATPRPPEPRLKGRRALDTPAHVGRAASTGVGTVSSSSRGEDVHESIDPLLDKISKHGLSSLTNSERAALERARVSLLRKERGG